MADGPVTMDDNGGTGVDGRKITTPSGALTIKALSGGNPLIMPGLLKADTRKHALQGNLSQLEVKITENGVLKVDATVTNPSAVLVSCIEKDPDQGLQAMQFTFKNSGQQTILKVNEALIEPDTVNHVYGASQNASITRVQADELDLSPAPGGFAEVIVTLA